MGHPRTSCCNLLSPAMRLLLWLVLICGVVACGGGGGGGSDDSTPKNTPPTALVTATPSSGLAPLLVTFDGSASDDPDGDPLVFEWDFGDGTTKTGQAEESHTYNVAGPYTARLTVSDGRGGSESALVSITVTATAIPVTVPDVVGMTNAAAESALEDAGLTVGAVSTASSATITAGCVISQDPAAGEDSLQGSAVDLVISVGPAGVTVPDVVDLSQAAATAAITGAGLTLGTVTTENSATVASGSVISQDPTAGGLVAPGSAVDIVVSLGPAMVSVPDVVDLTEAAATAALAGAGLTVGTVSTENSATVASGSVISQDPTAGGLVAPGSAVDIVVSLGPAMVSVPDVVDLTEAAATAALAAAGLTLGTVTSENSDTVAAGSIIRQSPTAGASAAPGSAVNLVVSLGPDSGLPPDPVTVATAVDRSVPTSLADTVAFLYEGTTPVQTGMAPGTIEAKRTAVLRGEVRSRDGTPLAGVTVSVLNHDEYGQTLTRADGMFDLVVNGGGRLTVTYKLDGYLRASRQVETPWQDFVWLPQVVLVPMDTAVTPIDFSAPMQVARGTPMTDTDGTRQSTLLCPQGTTAEMTLPDGSTQTLNTLHIRATEYTVGDNGPEAMPAALPPASAYTYCVDLTVDEALAAGAEDVTFSQPIYHYLENFLGFPVGGPVPTGYYDRKRDQWVASRDGRIVQLVGSQGDLAELDCDGDGVADDVEALASLNVTDDERRELASLYRLGQSLWRVPITHFSPWDCNWPLYSPAGGAAPPHYRATGSARQARQAQPAVHGRGPVRHRVPEPDPAGKRADRGHAALPALPQRAGCRVQGGQLLGYLAQRRQHPHAPQAHRAGSVRGRSPGRGGNLSAVHKPHLLLRLGRDRRLWQDLTGRATRDRKNRLCLRCPLRGAFQPR